jgi:hypothetical protein
MKAKVESENPFFSGKVTPKTPFERIEHVRYLVEHEDEFLDQIPALRADCDALRSSGKEEEWRQCREFLSLLDDYSYAVAEGSVTAASLRREIAAFHPHPAATV